ncbi:MAG: BON domain-containing protein [Chitinivibrionales bacterium]|nr:BON domain-containing protein [Chitinivibrionales bacterium]
MAQTAEDIRKSVVEQLLWDGRIEGADIDVRVDDHFRTTLTGTAPSYMVKQAAGEDTLRVSGVSRVYNQINVLSEDGGPRRSGEDLQKTIHTLISLYPNFAKDSVDVSVGDGKVVLQGSVDSYWKKLRAEEIAFDVKGVQQVVNDLTVVPGHKPLDEEIAESIQNALKRTGIIDPANVGIKVEGGRVTLSGTVDSWSAYSAAHTAAKYTRGVVDLTNELVIRESEAGKNR